MKFELGGIYITNGVDSMAQENKRFEEFVGNCLIRHTSGDWGDLCEEDKKTNEYALEHGERLFSKYNFNGEISIYIITEWDRSATTILFPSEY